MTKKQFIENINKKPQWEKRKVIDMVKTVSIETRMTPKIIRPGDVYRSNLGQHPALILKKLPNLDKYFSVILSSTEGNHCIDMLRYRFAKDAYVTATPVFDDEAYIKSRYLFNVSSNEVRRIKDMLSQFYKGILI